MDGRSSAVEEALIHSHFFDDPFLDLDSESILLHEVAEFTASNQVDGRGTISRCRCLRCPCENTDTNQQAGVATP